MQPQKTKTFCLLALLTWLVTACGGTSAGSNAAGRFDTEQQLVSAFDDAYQNRDGDAARSLFCNSEATEWLFPQLWEKIVVEHIFPGDGLNPELQPAAAISAIEYTIGDATSAGTQVEFNIETSSGSRHALALAVERGGGWVFCG